MASTVFSPGVVVPSTWLNDVNTVVYSPTGSSLVGFTQLGTGAVATTVQAQLRKTVFVSNYLPVGYVTDGSIDYSSQLQAAIDANKGKTIILDQGLSVLAAGILLDGSTYNNTRLICEGTFKLKASGGATNFGSAWVGIIVKDCDNVTAIIHDSDGNRSNQAATEFHHILGFAGATNFKVPYFSCREIRGDGIYISQKDWTSNTTNSSNGQIGIVKGFNTADDGRNLVSVVSCDTLSIVQIHSYQIGGTINAVVMPGGLDVEPDQNYQSCKNITVGSVLVVTSGTSGLRIGGVSGTTVTRDVVVGEAVVINTCAPTLASADSGTLSQSDNHTLIVQNAISVTVGGYRGRFTNAYGDAVAITNSDFVKVDGQVSHVRSGTRVGNDTPDIAGNGVRDSDINVRVTDISRFGHQTGKITRTKIRGNASAPVAGFYSTSMFGVQAISFTQTDCEYSVDVIADALWVKSYRADVTTPPTFTRSYTRNCDLQGTAWASENARIGDMLIPRYAVRGVTEQATIPTVGSWFQGTFVTNTAMALAAGKVTLGWSRLTTGTANVLNTDWAPAVCPNS